VTPYRDIAAPRALARSSNGKCAGVLRARFDRDEKTGVEQKSLPRLRAESSALQPSAVPPRAPPAQCAALLPRGPFPRQPQPPGGKGEA